MTQQEAELLRDRLKADLQKVEKYIEACRDINAIALRNQFGLLGESAAVASESNRTNGAVAPRQYGDISRMVSDAIRQCGNENYNVRDISGKLTRMGESISKLSIGMTLRRFADQGKIREMRPGSGRRPTKYSTVKL